MKYLLSIFLIGVFVSSAFSSEEKDLYGLEISEIQIKTKRIKEKFVKKSVTVKEGDVFDSGTIEKTRQELNRMRFFKKIDIVTEKDPAKNSVKIILNLEDGWFIFPLPFFSTGGGGFNGSLMFVERNIFKRAESIFLFGGGNRDGGFGVAGFQLSRFSCSVNYSAKSFTEWSYADGGYNTSGQSRSSHSEDDPGRYGMIRDQYEKKVEGGGFQTQIPLSKDLDGTLGFSSKETNYGNPVIGGIPSDQGKVNFVSAGIKMSLLKSGAGGPSDSSFSFQDFGAVFGFGMADLAQRIKPLPKIQKNVVTDFSVSAADRAIGSDLNYSAANGGAQLNVVFTNHQRVSFKIRGAAGFSENLPLSQKIATNRELGLRGNYAREYRGDRGIGASAVFLYPFRRTQRGAWTGEIFVDGSTVWDSGKSHEKKGLGFGFRYQFWRFPLPLGFTYSYSAEDKDAQVNFAFGGRF